MAEAKKKRSKRAGQYRILFYRDWCKECGICAAFCPTHAIVANELGRPSAVNPEACTNCHQCENRCPDFAVTVESVEEPT